MLMLLCREFNLDCHANTRLQQVHLQNFVPSRYRFRAGCKLHGAWRGEDERALLRWAGSALWLEEAVTSIDVQHPYASFETQGGIGVMSASCPTSSQHRDFPIDPPASNQALRYCEYSKLSPCGSAQVQALTTLSVRWVFGVSVLQRCMSAEGTHSGCRQPSQRFSAPAGFWIV